MVIALIGAAMAQALEQGATVEITGLGRKDAFWRYRKELIGLRCVVDAEGLVPSSRKWMGGSLTCEDGGTYYFFQVGVVYADYTPAVAPDGEVEGDVVATGTIGGASLGGYGVPWPVGARVKLTDVSSVDARYPEREKLVGKLCTVTDAPLAESGAGWWTGGVRCDDGADLYFYQVAVADGGTVTGAGAMGPVAVGTPYAGDAVAPGKMVRIADIGAGDQFGPQRAKLVGHACSVVEAPLLPTGAGWFTGRLFCDDGQSYQFYQVSVAPK